MIVAFKHFLLRILVFRHAFRLSFTCETVLKFNTLLGECFVLYSDHQYLFESLKPIPLCSGKYTPQYQWLEDELPKVNRSETPWLIVLMHSPWYNSYNYHYMEGETMRVMFEPWFVKYKVDLVFAGHVHAYERSVFILSPFSILVCI